MACDSSIVRPIDSFIKYFGDIKPYHTKILEIVEQYVFREEINVEFEETPSFEITLANDPLCKGVGFGLNFDDDCGFDALNCCDLFECIGGFGLIFDNSDLLVTLPVASISGASGQIVVPGSHLYDTYLNIKSIPNLGNIVVAGDQSAYFSNHEMFWVVRKNSYQMLTASGTTVTVSGDHAAQFLAKINLEIQNAGANDGHYGVLNATFAGGITTITLNRTLPAGTLGSILVDADNKNNGVYQINGFSIVGGNTVLQLTPDTPARLTDSEVGGVHGAIQLRTGFIPNRKVWIEGNTDANNGEWKITQAWYDTVQQATVLVVDGTLEDASASETTINIYGYETGAGFDGLNECSEPKPFNINAAISERLTITIFDLPGPTITPTMTVTLTPTPSATPVTPTPTMTMTPEASPTPTPTSTRAATPTVTPTRTVTPVGSPQPTISPTLTPTPAASSTPVATVTPTPTPTRAPSSTPGASVTPTPTSAPSPTPTPTTSPPVTKLGFDGYQYQAFRSLSNGEHLMQRLNITFSNTGTWTISAVYGGSTNLSTGGGPTTGTWLPSGGTASDYSIQIVNTSFIDNSAGSQNESEQPTATKDANVSWTALSANVSWNAQATSGYQDGANTSGEGRGDGITVIYIRHTASNTIVSTTTLIFSVMCSN